MQEKIAGLVQYINPEEAKTESLKVICLCRCGSVFVNRENTEILANIANYRRVLLQNIYNAHIVCIVFAQVIA